MNDVPARAVCSIVYWTYTGIGTVEQAISLAGKRWTDHLHFGEHRERAMQKRLAGWRQAFQRTTRGKRGSDHVAGTTAGMAWQNSTPA
jgi:hypothetical protein